MRQTYLAIVVFLQLLLVAGSDMALAQNPNQQQQLQQMMPSPSVQTPNFNAGRSNQPTTKRTEQVPRKTRHGQHKKE